MATLKRTPLSMEYGVEAACGERMRHLHSMVYRAAIAIAGTAADTIAGSLLSRAAIGGEAHDPRLMQRKCIWIRA